ncbi:MAG: class I SAM-dependent methyltransferase [Tateyamaria sp.]|uniref:class I SAM-dependent methyltransferase n=1 Tax=Tateyamaria sp. TaxID=1929288 RepID=UPI0032839B64
MSESVFRDLLDAGRGYESMSVPSVFATWTKHLIKGAEVQQGSQVMDIACGTGVLARDALAEVAPSGRVVGVDPAPGMLAAAREVEPAIDWIQCSAENLKAKDAAFDCVVCQFGMMFFSDRPKAIREMLRVLKPGGKLAIAVWDRVERSPGYERVISVFQKEVGTAAANALSLPYSLGDETIVTAELEAGGFTNVELETICETARFPSSRKMLEADLRSWLPLFGINLSEAKINKVLAASDATLSKYIVPSGEVILPTSAHIFTARKP